MQRFELVATGVRSLAWEERALVDWVAGGARHRLDGASERAGVNYAYRFDAAVTVGAWAVLHERLGTKGLVLRDGRVIRELSRSFYHANDYEYPIAIWLRDGRALLAHCPERYNQLEIEDLETGERLTRTPTGRAPADYFHSRLAVSPDGRRLLSAGWVWHPWDAVVWYDVAHALADGGHLDGLEGSTASSRNVGLAEEGSAAWLDDDRILLGGTAECEDPEEATDAPEPRLRPCGLAVWDVPEKRWTSSVVLPDPPGVLMPVGDGRVVTFFRHPRLVEIATGRVVDEWPDLPTGTQASAIRPNMPIVALDRPGRRFAVVRDDRIVVIALA